MECARERRSVMEEECRMLDTYVAMQQAGDLLRLVSNLLAAAPQQITHAQVKRASPTGASRPTDQPGLLNSLPQPSATDIG